jgi:hypothetical protein
MWLPLWSRGPREEDQLWGDKAYRALRTEIESLPTGTNRDEALKSIKSLECDNLDRTLASCDPSAQPPPEARAWRKALEAAGVDDQAYAKALAKVLRDLVC